MSTFRQQAVDTAECDAKSWTVRTSIASARSILEIEGDLWSETQAAGLITSTNPPLETTISLFIQAINELESQITAVIEQRIATSNVTSTFEELVAAAYPHAGAIKKGIITIGDDVEMLQEAHRAADTQRIQGDLKAPVEVAGVLLSVAKELLALYRLLCSSETSRQQQLREMAE